MIRIYKDNDIKFVTQGVYNNLYKPLGYKPIIEEKKEKKEIKVVQPKEDIKPQNKSDGDKQRENKESSKYNKRNRGE